MGKAVLGLPLQRRVLAAGLLRQAVQAGCWHVCVCVCHASWARV